MNPIWVIAKRELNSYFDSLIAYVFLVIFLGFTGFFTWFYPSDIFFRGQADMQVFFFFASWTLFFFIPAITMRQVAEERETGTIELLLTKAVTDQQVIVGKFLACFLLVAFALACTLPYYFSVAQLGDIDHGATVSGYLALLLLSAVYIAIGLLSSTVTKKQLVALILSLGIAVQFQIIFDMGGSSGSGFFATLFDSLSLNAHFESLSRGVWDTKDILYFLSLAAFFVVFAIEMLTILGRGKKLESNLKSPLPNILGIVLAIIFGWATWEGGGVMPKVAAVFGFILGETLGHLILNKRFTLILMFGIVVLINLISGTMNYRIDLTGDQQFTLSNATKNILKSLESPVTVTAYFTEELPPQVGKLKEDFRDKLIEYSNASDGMLDFEFIDPADDEALAQEIAQIGISPFRVQVREKDQVKAQAVYMSAKLMMNEKQEVLPIITSGTGMEYALTTAVKKMSVEDEDKPSVGLIQGHGEPGFQELQAVFTQLSILYNVENIDLNAEGSIPERFRAVALVAPKDSIPPVHFAKLDDYLARGGNLMVAIDAVNGDFQTAQGTVLTTGLETWLQEKGIIVDASFVIDAVCESVMVQEQRGIFRMQTPKAFPFLPKINTFPEHPITKGLEQVVMLFASNIRFSGDSSKTFTPIILSSDKSGIVNPPIYFDINKQWTEADFPLSNLVLGGIVEGDFEGGVPSKIVIFGDGSFPTQGGGQNSDQANLMSNTIDWLSDDTGLIDLRTKSVVTRPIKAEYMGDENEGKRNTMKFLNFGLPILLILLFGLYRFQRQNRLRKIRQSESYA